MMVHSTQVVIPKYNKNYDIKTTIHDKTHRRGIEHGM